jgi:hypothetical protein
MFDRILFISFLVASGPYLFGPIRKMIGVNKYMIEPLKCDQENNERYFRNLEKARFGHQPARLLQKICRQVSVISCDDAESICRSVGVGVPQAGGGGEMASGGQSRSDGSVRSSPRGDFQMSIPELWLRARARAGSNPIVVPGVNEPSEPFDTPHRVDLKVNFDDRDEQWRTDRAVHWCRFRTNQRWFRRIYQMKGIARFEFEDANEAMLFKLAHG